MCCLVADCIITKTSVYENENKRSICIFWIIVLVAAVHFILCHKRFLIEHRNIIFWLCAAAVAASLPNFMYGISCGHDWYFHLLRIDSIAQGLVDGQFPVRMNGIINSNYGYPVSIFYGDLMLYFPAVLRVIGFTINFSYKAYILFINFTTAAISYFCFSKVFTSKTALLSMCAYLLASYRLLNIYVRMAVGEYTAMVFFPLVLMSLWYIYHTNDAKIPSANHTERKASLLLALGMSGLLYSHVLSVEMTVTMLAIVALVEFKKTFTKRGLLIYIRAVALTLGLSASYYVPFLNYYFSCDTAISTTAGTAQDIGENGSYIGAYISDYFSFFRSVYGWNFVNTQGRMQITPGLVLMGGLILAIYIIFVKGEKSPALIKLTVASIALLWLASTLFPWDWWAKSNPIGNFMSQIRLPWRYVGMVCIVLAFLLGYILDNSTFLRPKKNQLENIAFACCFLMCFFFVSRFSEDVDQSKFINAPEAAIGSEYILDGASADNLTKDVTVSGGSGEIVSYKGVNKDIRIEVYAGGYADLPVFAYPYYEVTDENGNSYEITEGENRVIRVEFGSDYSGMLYVRFCPPWYWRAAELVSLVSAAGTLVYVLKRRRQERAAVPPVCSPAV